ncbi:MAG: protein TonB [Paraglaciecola sp.]|jgi:protein TonB
MSVGMVPDTVLPWSSSAVENKRFSQITQFVLVVTLLCVAWVNMVDIPETPGVHKEKLPPQLTRLIKAKPPVMIKKETPKPVPKVEEKPKAEKKKVEPVVKPVVKKAKPKIKPVEPVSKPVSKPDPKVEVAKAKAKAKQSGLLAFQDDLANMRKDLNLNNLAKTDAIKGGGQQAKTERKRIGKVVDQGSGGVETSNLSSNIGAKGELGGRRSTEFVAPNKGVASLAAKQIARDDEVIGNRDLESIRKIIGDHKGAIYSLYRKALRKNPELEGRVTVQLVIESDGSISAANILESELDDAKLEKRLLGRINLINFGAHNVTQTQLDYSFNFLPF